MAPCQSFNFKSWSLNNLLAIENCSLRQLGVRFKPYNNIELYKIFELFCADYSMCIDSTLKPLLKKFFKKLISKSNISNFGNGREVRNLFESMLLEQSLKINIDNINKEKLHLFEKNDLIECAKENYNISLTGLLGYI